MESSSVALRSMTSVAATAAFLGGMFSGGPARIVGKRQRPMTWSRSHQGAQEMARRQRQIERGQLTKSNGLVTPCA